MIDRDLHFLGMAARLALRGHGGAEPNPLVGCVIVSPRNEVVGWGYHERCGEAHAEIHALRRAGPHAKGATLYCTMEPCDHIGRTGPCTKAIIEAGVSKVIVARKDPNPIAACGLARLNAAGIATAVNDRCEHAVMVSDPFVHRIRTGLPWITVKWAQTIDGKIATRTGESKWISSDASRHLVHRERGRVDAILTGIGTVKCDDPMLTARHGTPRRIARRIVIDPLLEIPVTSKLVVTAREFSTIIICGDAAMGSNQARASALLSAGVELLPMPLKDGFIAIAGALRDLVQRYDISNVLVEAGPGVMSGLFQQGLVNEAWVFVAPLLLGDSGATAAISGFTAAQLSQGTKLHMTSLRRRDDDVIVRYRVK